MWLGRVAGNAEARTLLALQCRRASCSLQAGFTLIELMVVLLVIAILLTVAIPTMLGTSKSADGMGAKANLNTALIDSNAVFESNGDTFASGSTAQYAKFSSDMATTLSGREPNLGFTTSTSYDPSNISLSVSRGGNGLVLANSSPSGDCWYVIEHPLPISTINSANTKAPYGPDPTLSPTLGTKKVTKLVFPTTDTGTWYAFVSGDTTSSDCSASNPRLKGVGSEYQLAQNRFPD
jgi:prepilin-type N-terminal cleavage/methylation domain-containing protein